MQQNNWIPTNKDPHERAWVSLQMFGAQALEKVEAALKSQGFPSIEWYDILWALEREGPQRQRDLANHLLVARYSLSRLVDRMEANGLVERRECPEDLRGQMVVVTEAGLALRRKIWTAYSPALQGAMGKLNADEAAQLAALLSKLA
ncbi:MAG: MarR family winged helix-turn-helix transcriptional regulator [Terricaulis sp.]